MPMLYATMQPAGVTVEDLRRRLPDIWEGTLRASPGLSGVNVPDVPNLFDTPLTPGSRVLHWSHWDDEDRAMLADRRVQEHLRAVEAAFAAADRGENVDWEQVIDEHILG